MTATFFLCVCLQPVPALPLDPMGNTSSTQDACLTSTAQGGGFLYSSLQKSFKIDPLLGPFLQLFVMSSWKVCLCQFMTVASLLSFDLQIGSVQEALGAVCKLCSWLERVLLWDSKKSGILQKDIDFAPPQISSVIPGVWVPTSATSIVPLPRLRVCRFFGPADTDRNTQ